MKTPGYIVTDLFLVTILTTFMVLSISLQIRSTVESILVENTSGPSENHLVRKEE